MFYKVTATVAHKTDLFKGSTRISTSNLCFAGFATVFRSTALGPYLDTAKPPENSLSDEQFQLLASLNRLLTECSFVDPKGTIHVMSTVGDLKKVACHFARVLVDSVARDYDGQIPAPLRGLVPAIKAIDLDDSYDINLEKAPDSKNSRYAVVKTAFKPVFSGLSDYLMPHCVYRIKVAMLGYRDAKTPKEGQGHIATLRDCILRQMGLSDTFPRISRYLSTPAEGLVDDWTKFSDRNTSSRQTEDSMEMLSMVLDILQHDAEYPFKPSTLTTVRRVTRICKDTPVDRPEDEYSEPVDDVGNFRESTVHPVPELVVSSRTCNFHEALASNLGGQAVEGALVILPAGFQLLDKTVETRGVYEVDLHGRQMLDTVPNLVVICLDGPASPPATLTLPDSALQTPSKHCFHLATVLHHQGAHFRSVTAGKEGLVVADALAGTEEKYSGCSHRHLVCGGSQFGFGGFGFGFQIPARRYLVYELRDGQQNPAWNEALGTSRTSAPTVDTAYAKQLKQVAARQADLTAQLQGLDKCSLGLAKKGPAQEDFKQDFGAVYMLLNYKPELLIDPVPYLEAYEAKLDATLQQHSVTTLADYKGTDAQNLTTHFHRNVNLTSIVRFRTQFLLECCAFIQKVYEGNLLDKLGPVFQSQFFEPLVAFVIDGTPPPKQNFYTNLNNFGSLGLMPPGLPAEMAPELAQLCKVYFSAFGNPYLQTIRGTNPAHVKQAALLVDSIGLSIGVHGGVAMRCMQEFESTNVSYDPGSFKTWAKDVIEALAAPEADVPGILKAFVFDLEDAELMKKYSMLNALYHFLVPHSPIKVLERTLGDGSLVQAAAKRDVMSSKMEAKKGTAAPFTVDEFMEFATTLIRSLTSEGADASIILDCYIFDLPEGPDFNKHYSMLKELYRLLAPYASKES